jgi:hypothetical protein
MDRYSIIKKKNSPSKHSPAEEAYESQTIYVVTHGEYSDYSIYALFSTKKLAEDYIKANSDKNSYDSYDDYRIEEYKLDLFAKQLRKNLKPYFVRMGKDGFVQEIEKHSIREYEPSYGTHNFDRNNFLYMTVFAEDDKHAIKIVNEQRAILIANNLWGEEK